MPESTEPERAPEKGPHPARMMPLQQVFETFTNGDGTGWDAERTFLWNRHPRRLARIEREIRAGHFPHIRVDFDEHRVIDGHHRLLAAEKIGVADVPLADAWDDSGWDYYASDQGGDDPDPQALEHRRAQLIATMSAVSEYEWSAGWMEGLEERLLREGGIWEILGRAVGWPTGDFENWTWCTWDEAARIFADRETGGVDTTLQVAGKNTQDDEPARS